MRKLILSVMLAGAASAPAAAQRTDRADREQTREQRQEAREDRREAREEKAEPAKRPERPAQARVRASPGPAEAEATGRTDGPSRGQVREVRRTARQSADTAGNSPAEVRRDLRQENRETLRENRRLRQSERAVPPVLRNRVPIVSNTPRAGTQPPQRAERRRSSPVRWSSNWRHDNRYDWSNWRNRHRSLFRLGFYSDPFGWGYQRYSIGWRMWPNYYRSSFWLDDPWQYRLPYAPPGTRWIRYYDDAILVDTWDGRVVDVIYNFFW